MTAFHRLSLLPDSVNRTSFHLHFQSVSQRGSRQDYLSDPLTTTCPDLRAVFPYDRTR